MLIPNMIFILHNNLLVMEKFEILGAEFDLFASDLEKVGISSKKATLEKKERCILLFAFQ